MLWPSVVDKGVQEIAKGFEHSGARKMLLQKAKPFKSNLPMNVRHLWVVQDLWS